MSTFQYWWSGTRLENAPIQNDYSSIFRLVFHNDATDDTVIDFQLNCVDLGFNIRTPMDEDREIFYMYEITSQLFWYPQYPSYAKNENSYQLSQEVELSKH